MNGAVFRLIKLIIVDERRCMTWTVAPPGTARGLNPQNMVQESGAELCEIFKL